jgi:Ser/Thr protein kinase RdoA (MazF antagonist)
VTLRPPDAAVLRHAAEAFAVAGELVRAEPYGTGHINHTFAATFDDAGRRVRYLLQRINDTVFRQPLAVMENIERVTAHLRARTVALGLPDAARRVLTLVPASDGRAYHVNGDGHVWRCYVFVEGASSYDLLTGPEQARAGARAFGVFQRLLADYDGPRLHETIPHFHDTPSRLAALERAVSEDAHNRAGGARQEIASFLGRRPLARVLLALRDRGLIAETITHNDTKLNNVLLDDVTGEGICVVDLDTVMPGLALYDFGDMVRTATSPVPEDHPDPSAVRVRVDMFAALAHGWVEGAADAVSPVEREHLVAAGKLLTYECGMRFLTDHLAGDTYFRVHHPGHNLQRARTQLALLRSLEEHEDELQRLVAGLA